MGIKALSPATQKSVEGLLGYLRGSFRHATMDEAVESVETDAVYLSVDQDDGTSLYLGIAGPLVRHDRSEALVEFARKLDLAAALRRTPHDQRVWMVASGEDGATLRVAPRDDHSPGR